MGKVNEDNVRRGKQGTTEPWKRPGQASQDPAIPEPSKEDRRRDQRDNETA